MAAEPVVDTRIRIACIVYLARSGDLSSEFDSRTRLGGGWAGLCSGGCCCPCPCSVVQLGLGGSLLLVSRSACRASLCSSLGGLLVVVPEQPRAYVLSQLAHSGGWLVLGMLGHIPAPFERIIRGGARARLARRCSLVSTSNSTTRTPVLGGGARGSCSACSTFFTCRQHRPGAARFRCCCSSTIGRTIAHCFAADHITGAARFRCSWSGYKQGCRSGGWGVAASAASHARY